MRNTLSSVHQNQSGNKESLLFQFVLSVYVSAKEEILALQDHYENLSVAIKSKDIQKEKIQELAKSITLLSGSSSTYQPFSFLSLDTGSIAKLKNYCLLFLMHFHSPSRLAKQLKIKAENLWLESRELLSCNADIHLLLSFLYLQNTPNSQHLQAIKKKIDKLLKSIDSLGQVIASIAKKFSSDENVLFFLLCHRKKIDFVYGTSMTYQMLTSSSKDLKNIGDFIKKQYAARGFDELVPIISAKIAELETESSLPLNCIIKR